MVARVLLSTAAALSLAACAHGPDATQKSVSLRPPHRQLAARGVARAPLRLAQPRAPLRAPTLAARGLASYYWEGTKTANGEKFDGTELTAAHRSLPFGTRLKVTDEASGRSVTVRVNDRGPFIPGREIDLSWSAAEAIGMLDKGVTTVRLDVVK
ncbi:MAG: septal ring lytic transglycosylase RlpA family protein [Alphaproteobacteria bacterium]|nr:septal ring lytic transglycosylase RlpA family protein [Alphaproteobacteria bacterium]